MRGVDMWIVLDSLGLLTETWPQRAGGMTMASIREDEDEGDDIEKEKAR